MYDLKERTKKFAIDVWSLCSNIPKNREFDAYVRQLIRCSSSVGANYRAARRAKSNADFINKLKIVEEEADESMYFLELLQIVYPKEKSKIKELHTEANELVAIIVSSINRARKNN
ncbi:four helix bundle protein [Zunongwangia sp. SCSIO 43204]|uniref:four helix bundle protein n=1 Tax=Zunongwangia sp. SCSIO 43204 TaxID=2779359 RepID=UPI002104D3CF|nr:four helix bundle protein [Zunongwangia sp. SCSIO 43204]